MSISSPERPSSRTSDPKGKGLPELLARLARSLSWHWKRSLAAAVAMRGRLIHPLLDRSSLLP